VTKRLHRSSWLLVWGLPQRSANLVSDEGRDLPTKRETSQTVHVTYYPRMPIGKMWIYRLLFVCVCIVCVFVRLRISQPRIKLAKTNSARRFIGVQDRESHILGNFSLPKAPNRTNRAWLARWPIRPIEMRRSWNIARHVDVGSACVSILSSPKTDVLVYMLGRIACIA